MSKEDKKSYFISIFHSYVCLINIVLTVFFKFFSFTFKRNCCAMNVENENEREKKAFEFFMHRFSFCLFGLFHFLSLAEAKLVDTFFFVFAM